MENVSLSRKIDKSFYRFVNRTDADICIFWLKNLHERVFYRCVPPLAWVEIDTWDSHCWVFEDERTGDYRVVDQNCVFISQGMVLAKIKEMQKKNQTGPIMTSSLRKTLSVMSPLLSLKSLAEKAIRDTGISLGDLHGLNLPKVLIESLTLVIKRRDCFENHVFIDFMCTECPFDIQSAHLHDSCNLPGQIMNYGTVRWNRR